MTEPPRWLDCASVRSRCKLCVLSNRLAPQADRPAVFHGKMGPVGHRREIRRPRPGAGCGRDLDKASAMRSRRTGGLRSRRLARKRGRTWKRTLAALGLLAALATPALAGAQRATCTMMGDGGLPESSGCTTSVDADGQRLIFEWDGGRYPTLTLTRLQIVAADPVYAYVAVYRLPDGRKALLEAVGPCYRRLLDRDRRIILEWRPLYTYVDKPGRLAGLP